MATTVSHLRHPSVDLNRGLRTRNWEQGTGGLDWGVLTKKLARTPPVPCSAEQETHKPLVGGSNPSSATFIQSRTPIPDWHFVLLILRASSVGLCFKSGIATQ